MASTSAVHLLMRKKRAAALVEEHVDAVSVDNQESDEAVIVRLSDDETYIASIVDTNPSTESASPARKARFEYVTEGTTRAKQKATEIKQLLSRRAG